MTPIGGAVPSAPAPAPRAAAATEARSALLAAVRGLLAEVEALRADGERWRLLRDNWPNVTLGWCDEETGSFGGERGDVPIYARTPVVADERTGEHYGGDTPDEAVDAARVALAWAESLEVPRD